MNTRRGNRKNCTRRFCGMDANRQAPARSICPHRHWRLSCRTPAKPWHCECSNFPILRLLRRLCDDRGVALVLVTHDFGVVAAIADRVAVMYAGRVVEYAVAPALFRNPRHPYAQGLLTANPRRVLDADSDTAVLDPIPGSPPNPFDSDSGCSFAPRCSRRHDLCASRPLLRDFGNGHSAACWLPANG